MGHSAIHRDLLAEQVVEQFKVAARCRVGRAVGGAIDLQTVVKLLAHGHNWGAVKRHRRDVPAVFPVVGGTPR